MENLLVQVGSEYKEDLEKEMVSTKTDIKAFSDRFRQMIELRNQV